MKHHRIENAVHQLDRYGGAPDGRILRLLELLTDINDDIWHMRNPKSAIDKARELLNQIEHSPTLDADESDAMDYGDGRERF